MTPTSHAEVALMHARLLPRTVFSPFMSVDAWGRGGEPPRWAARRLLFQKLGVLTVAVPPVMFPVVTSKLKLNDARPARADLNPTAVFG